MCPHLVQLACPAPTHLRAQICVDCEGKSSPSAGQQQTGMSLTYHRMLPIRALNKIVPSWALGGKFLMLWSIGYAVYRKPKSYGKSGKGGRCRLSTIPGGLQGGSSVAVPILGGVIGVVRVVSLRSLTELNGKSGMKGVWRQGIPRCRNCSIQGSAVCTSWPRINEVTKEKSRPDLHVQGLRSHTFCACLCCLRSAS